MYNIPEKINMFNIYDEGDKLRGITEEVTLPDVEHMTETISGPGIIGEIDDPTPGMISSMEVEIPYRAYDKEFFKLQNPMRSTQLTLRGAVQFADTEGGIQMLGMRIVFKGRGKGFTGGSVKQGAAMGASVKLELTYYMVEIDGNKVTEIDKLNGVFVVNGEDILAEARDLC